MRRSSFASLSGGQRQRLFIALALLNEPRVVFFDELTQGLDPLARGDVWDAIRDVRDRGTTVVLVTHFMLPVHLASYRERGVLRRFDVSRYPRWALPAAWILVATVITLVAVAVLLVTGYLVYGLPAPDNILGVAVGTLLGAVAFISIGIAWEWPCPAPPPPRGSGCCSSSPSSCSAAPAHPPTRWETR